MSKFSKENLIPILTYNFNNLQGKDGRYYYRIVWRKPEEIMAQAIGNYFTKRFQAISEEYKKYLTKRK